MEQQINNTTVLIEGLLITLLESYNLARIWHLQTESHAEHKALEGYYESIEGHFDSIAEQYQGTMGNGYRIKYLKPLQLVSYSQVDMNQYFDALLDDVQLVIEQIKEVLLFSHLVNNLDEVKSTISKMSYLLTLK